MLSGDPSLRACLLGTRQVARFAELHVCVERGVTWGGGGSLFRCGEMTERVVREIQAFPKLTENTPPPPAPGRLARLAEVGKPPFITSCEAFPEGRVPR